MMTYTFEQSRPDFWNRKREREREREKRKKTKEKLSDAVRWPIASMIHPHETRENRTRRKRQQQKIQEAAKPHRIKVRSGALTVLGGRYFRQTDQRADWIGCSSLKACFDENADKQPLDHLGRRLPTLLFFLFFSLLPAPQTGHCWPSCHLSWPAEKGKRRDGFVYIGWNMSSQ